MKQCLHPEWLLLAIPRLYDSPLVGFNVQSVMYLIGVAHPRLLFFNGGDNTLMLYLMERLDITKIDSIRKTEQENEKVLVAFSETALPNVPSVQIVTILQKNAQYWYSLWLHEGYSNDHLNTRIKY